MAGLSSVAYEAGSAAPLRRRIAVRNPIGYLFVLPYAIFFSAMIAYPLGYAFYLAFHEWSIVAAEKPYVGLDNFDRLLHDDLFWKALRNTVKFLVVNVPVTVVVSMVLAVALNRGIRGRAFFRAAYFLPYVTAGVVIALIWKWMFSTDGGFINNTLELLHLPQIGWLTEPFWSMITIALMVAWKQMGFYVVLYLGGLQGIPQQLYEAAEVDGANAFQRFRDITVPQLRPITMLVVILSTIVGFQLFTEPYIMTGGGPLNSSLSVVLYIYQKAFQSLEFGYAAAIGVVLAVIIMTTALIQRRFLDVEAA
jgi:multiple sugar transport system permease protein